MICHDKSWYLLMIYHDISWFIMICHDRFMMYHDTSWYITNIRNLCICIFYHPYELWVDEITILGRFSEVGMEDSTVYTAVHTVQYAVTVQGFFENWNTVFSTGLGFYRVFGVQICKITVFLQWPINFVRIKTGFNSVFYWDRIKSLGFTGFLCEFCKHCDTAVFILSLYSVLGQYSISDAKKNKFHP